MKASFSFCGVDIADLGLSYAPEIQDTYVYRPPDATIHEQVYEGHHGGYVYGATYPPKEFTLKCIFEEKQIDKGIMSQIYYLFKAGKSGKLIFTRRPWCYYYATVTQAPDLNGLTNYLNGAIVIGMKAYYPFARSDIYYRTRTQTEYDNIKVNSAVPFLPDMPPYYTEITDSEGNITDQYFEAASVEQPLTEEGRLILLNPGTERAAVGIQIAGDASQGVTITNSTTRQKCKFTAMSAATLDGSNSWVYCDGINGKTILHKNNADSINFLYHSYGFIELEPAYPAVRDLIVMYSGGNIVTVNNILHENLTGRYIYLRDGWHKILAQPDKHHLQVRETIIGEDTMMTMVASMNELYIQPVDTMRLTRLRFYYKPTYS